MQFLLRGCCPWAVLAFLLLGKSEAITVADPKLPEPRTMLTEPADLEKKLKQPGLRILDARPSADYTKGHSNRRPQIVLVFRPSRG